jgi:hypothetical protein
VSENSKLPKICRYCDCDLSCTNYSYFLIRVATKPSFYPHRWKHAGYCCDDCEEAGKPTSTDRFQAELI